MADQFGNTRKEAEFAAVAAWRDAAVADGWDRRPTYIMPFVASISLWGPDGLAITPPATYDWPAIQAGATTCRACKKVGVKTVRYSFAGRCCEACLPAMRAAHEKPGWNN